MNTYAKYCPNVFVAKCDQEHERGETIQVETKYGTSHECIVFNKVLEKDGFYYYSIVRSDGFNAQKRAKMKAERYNGYSNSATKKSNEYFNKSNKDREFLILGEPIKVGHHSELRHRKAIEQANNNMGKSVELNMKADKYDSKAEYWESKTNDINLSMPESIEYFEYKLQIAKEFHEGLKSGKYERRHGMSLSYAKKDVNDLQNKYNTAIKLWK